MFVSIELISAQSEQIKKNDHFRSGLDSTSSFTISTFLSTEFISAQSKQFSPFQNNYQLRAHSEIQQVASKHRCFLV